MCCRGGFIYRKYRDISAMSVLYRYFRYRFFRYIDIVLVTREISVIFGYFIVLFPTF